MRVETPVSIHGCYDVVHKCGFTYVITPNDTPLQVEHSEELFAPEQHVRVYRVKGTHAIINGTLVNANEYHVSTCKLAFTTMERASARYIENWCAYHQHIGADFFFIYDNNSTDEEFADIVEAAKPFPGIIFRWNYPFVYGDCTQAGQQTHSICISKYSVQRLGLTDLDEFLVVEKGTLDQLITPPLVRIFWRWFGQCGIHSDDPRDYIRSTKHRESKWYCKVICDPTQMDIGLIHNAYGPGITSVTGENAALYHYRGLTNNKGRECDMENHEQCQWCEVDNTTLVQLWKRSN